MSRHFVAVALIALSGPTAAASIFKCNTADGSTSYQNTPCAAEAEEVDRRAYEQLSAPAGPTWETQAPPRPRPARSPSEEFVEYTEYVDYGQPAQSAAGESRGRSAAEHHRRLGGRETAAQRRRIQGELRTATPSVTRKHTVVPQPHAPQQTQFANPRGAPVPNAVQLGPNRYKDPKTKAVYQTHDRGDGVQQAHRRIETPAEAAERVRRAFDEG
jgi:hypothetical protein